MTDLLRPDNADLFRVSVGRYGERWYTDPLPACPIAPASTANWPSVSTVKKASGGDWSFVALQRCADELAAHPQRYVGMDAGQLYDAFKNANKDGLNKAARRGTAVHAMCEQMLEHGRITDDTGAPEYRAAVEQFFDTYQPEQRVVEAVAIHRDLNGHGYGGTGDAGLVIGGQLIKVDWKSRGVDSKHGAYPEEAAQIAAYARAQYIIELDGAGEACRSATPAYAEGWVVSIKPDGARVYPVDLDLAWSHWTNLHAWWVARLDERKPVGRSLPVKAKKKDDATVPVAEPIRDDEWPPLLPGTPTAPPPEWGDQIHAPAPQPQEAPPSLDEQFAYAELHAELVERYRKRIANLTDVGKQRLAALWPQGVPTFKASRDHTPEQLAAIEAVLAPTERADDPNDEAPFDPPPAGPKPPGWTDRLAELALQAAFPGSEPVQPDTLEVETIDDGAAVPESEVDLIEARLKALPAKAAEWVGERSREMADAGRPLRLRANPFRRRLDLARVLVELATKRTPDKVAAKALEALGMADLLDVATIGAVMSALTADEAWRLADAVTDHQTLNTNKEATT